MIDDLKINDAFSDAIDIDMSENIFLDNIEISNSKNDAIDLMESTVIIENSQFNGSKDKGISVGENSFLILKNSKIANNKIGVATKDSSYTFANNVVFDDNIFHIENYKKNWRYGDGGISVIHNSNFIINDKDNKNYLSQYKSIKSDELSSVKVVNSKIKNTFFEKNIISKKNKEKHLKRISDINISKIYDDFTRNISFKN